MLSYKRTQPFVISVEGIISAGKTSLIEEVLVPLWTKKGLRVRVIEEPVDKWKEDILPEFYGNPKRWAYHFQSKAFHDRVMESKQMWDLYKDDTDIFILDRSIFSDPQFMKVNRDLGNVSEMEMRHYLEWWNMWKDVMPFTPNLFIYLNISVEESMKRIPIRGRTGEHMVSVEYQSLLKKYHDEVFGLWVNIGNQPVRVFELDSSIDYKNNECIKQTVADDILGLANCVIENCNK